MKEESKAPTKSLWVNTPRDYRKDWLDNNINDNEYDTLLHLRPMANAYGIVVISFLGLAEEVFRRSTKADKNNINKILLSLKEKKYIWYESRQGRNGPFQVLLDDFLVSKDFVLFVEPYFNKHKTPLLPQSSAEVIPEVNRQNQKSILVEPLANTDNLSDSPDPPIRSSNTDSDNHTYNYKADTETPVDKFEPKNGSEHRTKEIAKALGEKDINFLLSVFNKFGLGPIEQAYGQYREASNKAEINNPAAYVNQIIKRLLGSNSG